ncbi:MAG: hypothetical protein AAGG01_15580 [Planctomycetota bacterium]
MRGRIGGGSYSIAQGGADPVPPGQVFDLTLLDFTGDGGPEIAAVTDAGLALAHFDGTSVGFAPHQGQGFGLIGLIKSGSSSDQIGWLRRTYQGTEYEFLRIASTGAVGATVPMTGWGSEVPTRMTTGYFDNDSIGDAMVAFGAAGQLHLLQSLNGFVPDLTGIVALDPAFAVDHVAVGDAAGDRDLDLVCKNGTTGQVALIESSTKDGPQDRPQLIFSDDVQTDSYSMDLAVDDWRIAFKFASMSQAPPEATHVEVLVYAGHAIFDGEDEYGDPIVIGGVTGTAPTYRNVKSIATLETGLNAAGGFYHVPLYGDGPTDDLYEFLVVRYGVADSTGQMTRVWPANAYSMIAADASSGPAIGFEPLDPEVIDVVEYVEGDNGSIGYSGREITCVDPVPDLPLPSTPPPTGNTDDDDDNSDGGAGEPGN